MLAFPATCPGRSSSSTLTNEQASKSGRWNHSSKTSKIASSLASGVEPRFRASSSTKPYVRAIVVARGPGA
jgi:hypothetical protein